MIKITKLIDKFVKKTKKKPGHQTDDSAYDKETRGFLKTFVPSKISEIDKGEPIKVLMLGSPGLQEIRDIPDEILSRFEITGVDKSYQKPLNLPVKKYKYHRTNVFDFLKKHNNKNKYDIVLNRWFLHHISEHNKDILCKKVYDVLSDNGFFITLDWFIDEWDTPEELQSSQVGFYEYRVKYLPHQVDKLNNKIKKLTPQQWWEKLHNDCDWSGGKSTSRKRLAGYLQKAGYQNTEIYDVGDTEVIDDPYLWGDVVVCAQKKQ